MPASRKSKIQTVSLAGPQATATAGKRSRGLAVTVSDGATPERLAHAAGRIRIETFDRQADGSDPSARHGIGQRVRIDESPLDRLRVRRLLASGPNAEARNLLLAEAGERYRRYWRGAGLDPLRAIDMSREQVSGNQTGLLRSERQLTNFQAYGNATKMLEGDARRVVEAIVLREREPVDVGQEVSGYRQEKQATAVALYVLRTALQTLAVHFGLIQRGQCVTEPPATHRQATKRSSNH